MGVFMPRAVFSTAMPDAPRAVNGSRAVGLAAVVAILTLSYSVWQFVQALHQTPPAGAEITTAANPSTFAAPGVSAITQRYWFGIAAGDAAVATQTSNLVLKGISRTDNASVAGAFIAEPGKLEHFYRVGETLPGQNGTLQALAPDHVVIMRGGVPSRLGFDDVGAAQPSAAAPNASGASSPFILLPPDAPRSESLARTTPAELAKRFMSDPEALLASAGLERVSANGKTGYALNGANNAALFARAGMNHGDVVLAVNGRPVGTPSSDRLLVPGLLTAKTLELEVLRGGKKQMLSVPVP